MKRLSLICIVFLVGAAGAFGIDFWIGPNAYYESLIQPEDVRRADASEITLADFALGGELRTYIRNIWGSAVAIYTSGGENDVSRFLILTDIGLSMKLWFLRAGVGIGPDFGIALRDEGARGSRMGANFRITTEVVLRDLSVGLSWFTRTNPTAEDFRAAIRDPYGYLGVTALIRL